MGPFSVMFARFPYGGTDRIDVTDWLVETIVKCKLDPRISNIPHVAINDTPITMSRNKAVELAKSAKADYLVMIDSDMKPDCYLASNSNRLDTDSSALPFWDSSWDFMLKHYEHGPCMIGAPYCGPPPHENVYIFRWANFQTDHPNADLRIEQYTREESVIRTGFEEVACLPTGLVIIDMRVFNNPLVSPPYFSYEWADKYEMKKSSTEDCVFTRDLNLANIPLYVNWDAWAGHWKMKCVGRPRPIFREQVHQKFLEAVEQNISRSQKIRQVRGWEVKDAGVRATWRGSIDLASQSHGLGGFVESGVEGQGSGDREDGGGAVEVQPNLCAASTEVPRRSFGVGVFSRKPVADTCGST